MVNKALIRNRAQVIEILTRFQNAAILRIFSSSETALLSKHIGLFQLLLVDDYRAGKYIYLIS